MCKYCEKLFTGDYGSDLIEFNVGMGRVSDLFRVSSWLGDTNNSAFLFSNIVDQFGTNIALEKVEIHYCPVCGRKF